MFLARTLILFLIALVVCSAAHAQAESYGVGNPAVFIGKYRAFAAERIRGGEADILRIQLGHVKGLSRSFVGAAGELRVDLESGKYLATLRGLEPGQRYSLWLVDRPEPQGDLVPAFDAARSVKLAEVSGGIVTGMLGAEIPADFTLDRVNLLRGADAVGEIVASGSLNVFQKLFYRRLDPVGADGSLALAQSARALPARASLVPDVARETIAAQLLLPGLTPPDASTNAVPLDTLISQGATLFFVTTFNGNGRTCGTCHPVSNNFTIDVPFIASLPPNDPLFVAENVAALAQLERPALMRQFGLILENLDGLDDATNKFVMRSVPHTLGMQVSLQQDTSLPSAPAQMTGWSGDGAPVSGSLRDFAIGAVTQHFTKSLARNAGLDFILPSEHQLDAMEAFQLSLGRATDFNLTTLVFSDPNVDAGKIIFRDGTGDPAAGGRCAACHGNGGAIAANGQNRNFNTNVEDVPNAAQVLQTFPHDGGFGQTPNPDGTFGNRTFNTPPIVEAADTAPFFHNNLANTLEEVLAFYTGPVFNLPRAAAARFALDATQRERVADFMRALNALQNIQVARRELQEILALSGNPQNEIRSRLDIAAFDTADAIAMLNQGGIYPLAAITLTTAQQNIALARAAGIPLLRNPLIQTSILQLNTANAAIAP